MHLPDEGPVHVGELRERFLADAESLSVRTDALAKDPGGFGLDLWHAS